MRTRRGANSRPSTPLLSAVPKLNGWSLSVSVPSAKSSASLTWVNVVHTLRGLWAIALVGSAGRWLGNDERAQAGPGVLARRLVSVTAILGAVVLAVAAAW